MRRIVVWLVVVGFGLSLMMMNENPTQVSAQDSDAVTITVSFDEVAIDALCADAFNAYAPDVTVAVLGDAGAFGPSIIADSGDASGIAPECQIAPGEGFVLELSRPAYGLSFNRYGTVGVTLLNNGDTVGRDYEVSSGLGGRFERTEFVGFDRILLFEDSGTTPLLIDEMDITFDSPAVTTEVDFFEVDFGASCADAINMHPLLTATVDSTTDFATPFTSERSDAAFDRPECEFSPGNVLTVNFPQPAVTVSFDLYGGADLQLFLEGAQVGEVQDVSGLPIHYKRTRVGGFDQIVLTEPSGFSSFQLDNLTVTFLVEGERSFIGFDDGIFEEACADVINATDLEIVATVESSTDFEEPFIDTDFVLGAEPSCEFDPGNSLILTLPQPATAISFLLSGGANVQLLRDGNVIGDTTETFRLRRYYARIDAEGFDQVIITESSGFSSFTADNIQIVYGE